MKIALYSRSRSLYTSHELKSLLEVFDNNLMECWVNTEFAEQISILTGQNIPPQRRYSTTREIPQNIELMVTYGGDGTFLDAVRILGGRPVPIIGVNSGRLGFLANITKDSVEAAFRDIATGLYTTQQRPLIECSSSSIEGETFPYAFNEVTIQRRGVNMIACQIYVDSEMIATCHGDGVLISTPSGSTAYSLSVGGPVVAPDCDCFIISPIAPHNLTMRPVVVPDSSVVTIKVVSRGDNFNLSLDNRNYDATDSTVMALKKAKKSVFLVHLRNISFYDTLRNKMMWGVDSRDSLL